jgi:hypothetical protein
MTASIDEQLFRGFLRGLAFGCAGGTLMGVFYAVDVVTEARVPWTALLVHAYSIASLAGALPMAVNEVTRERRGGGVLRVLALVATGAAAGCFGATHIATLPDTPYPGPVLASGTLLVAALGFSLDAQPARVRRPLRIVCAVLPLALVLPLAIAFDVREAHGALGLPMLRLAAKSLGLAGVGLAGGALAGFLVGTYGELAVTAARLVTRSELAPNGQDRTERTGRA